MTTTTKTPRTFSTLKAKRVAAYWGKVLLGLIFLLPLFIGLLYSFVPNELLLTVPSFEDVFSNLTVQNYIWVMTELPMPRYFLNTIYVSFVVIIGSTILCSMAAYAFSFFRFPGREFFFNLILVSMMIPGDVVIIANYLQIQEWGLLNTYTALFITSLVGGTDIFLIRQYFKQMPREISEAAVMDGCGKWRFMYKIAMPMAKAPIVSLAITGFIGAYNMYFWPLLVTNKTEMRTVQVGMAMLRSQENLFYGRVLAGAIICAVVPMILFIFAQDHIIKGMSAGAVKG